MKNLEFYLEFFRFANVLSANLMLGGVYGYQPNGGNLDILASQ